MYPKIESAKERERKRKYVGVQRKSSKYISDVKNSSNDSFVI
jgi:hypothetical protein